MRAASISPRSDGPPHSHADATGPTRGAVRMSGYGMWTPLIARATTSRWISDVPSKIV
jgi:hypothetical protein